MKFKLLFVLMGLLGLCTQAQTFSPSFLDGRIMFQLRHDPVRHFGKQPDKNHFALEADLSNYPELVQVFNGIDVTRLEIPAYFTGKPELQKIFRVYFTDFSKIDQLVESLRSLPQVAFAEKEPIYKTDFVPNDTYHNGNNKWYHTLVGSEAAWNTSLGSNSVKIAIVDNAVFCGHADLTTFSQYDVADNDNNASPPQTYSQAQEWSHGTHCAGLATADINNATGIASLGGNVELIGVKATPNSASSGNSVWYSFDGVLWACENGANVVSMSFGGTNSASAFQTLINSYPSIVFMAAAGNDGNTTVNYPAAYQNVICVGSVDSNDSRSSFSNYNGSTSFVDIAAPGGFSFGGLYSTVYSTGGNSYAQMGGTSMATPFAAGLVGLMLSINPTLTPTAVLSCLTSTGVAINQSVGPRINAPAAVQCVSATLSGDPLPFFNAAPTNIIQGNSVTFYNLSAQGGSPITNYSWSFPGGSPSSFIGATPPTITYNTPGTYTVSLSATNSQSTQTYTQNNYINVSPLPFGEWIVQNTGFTTAARGINHLSIVDPNVVWATAYDGSATAANVQQFTKTTNGGTTWTPGNISIGNTALGISMIHAFSATKAWLAAYPNAAGQTGGIWVTNNGGSSWTRQNTATFNNASSFTNTVHFWDANNGVCMGDPINGEFEIYTTTNGGTNWSLVAGTNIPNPQSGEYGYVRQMEVVGDHVWFTTNKGRIYYSSNRGSTWSVFTSPITDFGGTTSSGQISFTSPTEGLLVNQAGTVWKTINSGSTWTQLTTTGSVFTTGLCYIEGTSTAFTTGAASGSSGSSYSTDGGVTWNLIDTQQHLYVDFTDLNTGWSGWFNTSATANGMWKWNYLFSPLQVDFNASSTIACVNQAVTFTDLTTGGTVTTWNWQFPGASPSVSALQNPIVTYPTPGTYLVSLTASDGNTQSTYTDSTFITVVSPLSPPGLISGPTVVCAGAANAYSVQLNPDAIYNWTLPPGWSGMSTSNNLNTIAGLSGGTLSVSAENACGGTAASSLTIQVDSLPPVASFTWNNSTANVAFQSTSSNTTSWFWEFGDGNTANIENPGHFYSGPGSYTVLLTASNVCGQDTAIQNVTITIVGINEVQNNELILYPNPFNETVNVILPHQLVGSDLTLTDALGKVISTIRIVQQHQSICLKELAPGIYFLHGSNGQNTRILKN